MPLTTGHAQGDSIKPLQLIFIGETEHYTRLYFKEFLRTNRAQVASYFTVGVTVMDQIYPVAVKMTDGSVIRRAPSTLDRLDGLRLDQVIVACDRRGVRAWPERRLKLLNALIDRASWSERIQEEDRVIIFELDEREA